VHREIALPQKHRPRSGRNTNQCANHGEMQRCHTATHTALFPPGGAWWCLVVQCSSPPPPPAPAVCTPQRQASGDGSLPGQWGDGGSSAGVPGSRLKGVAHPHRSINATRMPAALAFSPDDDHAGLRRIGASLGRRSGSGSGEEALPSVLTMPAARQSPADVS
jgi:hypothetical protein